ncbi:hypothetical protein GCM10007209_26160 [Haloferax sulfurifontis]|uniref:Uncharacterized protein n=1 Tax=Haloferax sulfurifontis TaxID=255616 RepID=A0A830E7S1_9EURY|nr:hypothetical protein GCM10007209_26160 [Haloferax sulfurifontis]
MRPRQSGGDAREGRTFDGRARTEFDGGCLVCFLVSHARGLATAHDNPFEIHMCRRRAAGGVSGRRARVDGL